MQHLLSDLGLILIPALFAICFGGLALALTRALREGSESYANEYAQDASRQFEDLFLFIPARRIADLGRVMAVLGFLLFFFIFGGFESARSIVAGTFFGAIGGAGALRIPRVVLRILKQRRLERFNQQLVDSLVTMSNALRAGFSIMQALESVVKQNQNPISLEFGLFLQQNRIGIPFEDALNRLDERVGSEDLTLMIRSIEIARLTGGNLTEVFDQIAETIRERIRIEGRLKSLTAMGKMQAIVVGSIPMLLLVAMFMLDPVMMRTFVSSAMGLSMIALVLILEVLGFLVIRKIVSINI